MEVEIIDDEEETASYKLDPFFYPPETLKFLEHFYGIKMYPAPDNTTEGHPASTTQPETDNITGGGGVKVLPKPYVITGSGIRVHLAVRRMCVIIRHQGPLEEYPEDLDDPLYIPRLGTESFYARVPDNQKDRFGCNILVKVNPLWTPWCSDEVQFDQCPRELVGDAFRKLAGILRDGDVFESYYASKKGASYCHQDDVFDRQFVINVPNSNNNNKLQTYVIRLTPLLHDDFLCIKQPDREMIANALEELAHILYEEEKEKKNPKEKENPGGGGYPVAPVQQQAGYGYGCDHPPPHPTQPGYPFGFYPPNHQSQAAGRYDYYSQAPNSAYQQSNSLGQAYTAPQSPGYWYVQQQNYTAGYANASVQPPPGYYGPPWASGQPTYGQPPLYYMPPVAQSGYISLVMVPRLMGLNL